MVKALPAASTKRRDDHPEILREQLRWMPAGATEPLLLDLVEIFREGGLKDGR